MHKVFLGIALLTQISFCMQSLDDKPLPEDFVQKVANQNFYRNCSFYRFQDTLRKRTQPISAKELHAMCTQHAQWDDDACERNEELRAKNCTIFGQAQRHLSCWWLHKQALVAALDQK